MNSDVWCCIPVYNNAATIYSVAQHCRELIPQVVVIDDGSTDADLTLLLKPLDVTVIRHPKNLGKGEALLTAFRFAAQRGARYAITLDGDGQHFPADLPLFLPQLSPETILIGYREIITGEMPKSSRFGRDFSDFWICVEAGGYARDTQSGFRAYPLDAILQLQLASHFFNLEMEIITKALWAGLLVKSVPIHAWYPPGEERVSSFDPFWDNLRISLLHTRLVLRQLLPIPHRQLFHQSWSFQSLYTENASPLGLAVSAALAIVMGIVLWPYGILAAAYISIRLHLNKACVAIFVALSSLPLIPPACTAAGKLFISSQHLLLQWIVGSHLIAVPVAVAVGCVVYKSAAHFAGISIKREA